MNNPNDETSLCDAVRASITLPKLEILEESETGYHVSFGDEEYLITKGEESRFVIGTASTNMRAGMRQVMTHAIEGTFIEQDESAPSEFREVMMVHEIRETEYKNAGLDDAHERAVHDEILYVLKHLPASIQGLYFEFANKYRHTLAQQQEQERIAEEAKQRDARRKKEIESSLFGLMKANEKKQLQALESVGLVSVKSPIAAETRGKKQSEGCLAILVFSRAIAARNERGEWDAQLSECYELFIAKPLVKLSEEFVESIFAEIPDVKIDRKSTVGFCVEFADMDRALSIFERLHEEVIRRKRKK